MGRRRRITEGFLNALTPPVGIGAFAVAHLHFGYGLCDAAPIGLSACGLYLVARHPPVQYWP
jgi:hypothetical protein